MRYDLDDRYAFSNSPLQWMAYITEMEIGIDYLGKPIGYEMLMFTISDVQAGGRKKYNFSET